MIKSINKKMITILVVLIVLLLTIGYSILTTTLNINGTSAINSSKWDVHLENVQVEENSVSASNLTINDDKDTVTFSVTLNEPGDYYEFNVDAVNKGTIDAMVDLVTKTTLTNDQKKFLTYEVSYSDDVEINENDILIKEMGKETLKMLVKLRDDINSSDLPSSAVNLTLNASVKYVQADSKAKDVMHDPLLKMLKDVKAGNTSSYSVGDEFEVNVGSFGTHTLRIANMSTPSECENINFSQSACGFVLEFKDIITTHSVNSSPGNNNGWPESEIREFVNNDIYNALPNKVKNAIIDTVTISGYGYALNRHEGTGPGGNWISTDKLYLLATHEVSVGEEFNPESLVENDKGYNYTRQLDYYENIGVTQDNYAGGIKKLNGTDTTWRLRSIYYMFDDNYFNIYSDGNISSNNELAISGVSPAFRIA